VIDEIITANIKLKTTSTFSATLDTYWCGWHVITSTAGLNGAKYTSCSTVACSENNTAGQVWISFNILAILVGYLPLGYGLFYDIRQGAFDVTSIQAAAAKLGCNWNFGYTILGTIVLLFWQLLGIIIYGATQTCSKSTMWKDILLTVSYFKSFGGASLAFDILSLIFIVAGLLVLISIRVQYGQLPKSKTLSTGTTTTTKTTKTVPRNVEKQTSQPEGVPNNGETVEEGIEAPTAQAPAVPAEPPNSKFFNPSRTYQDANKNKSPAKNTTVPNKSPPKPNASKETTISNKKPSKPPPMPGNKPNVPPPLPPGKN